MQRMKGLRAQFEKPEGILGWVASRLMLASNRPLTEWALDLLRLQPSDEVLEIGFGPGYAMEKMAERVMTGHLAGVDISPLMVRVARGRNAEAIRRGRVDLHEGSVERLPFGDARFDKLVAINSVQFWPDLEAGLREAWRVLRPGGRVVIVLQDRSVRSPAEVPGRRDHVVAAVKDAGFTKVTSEIRNLRPIPAFAVVGQGPAE